MAIRDRFNITLRDGHEIFVSARRPGGSVTMAREDPFLVFSELSKGGALITQLWVQTQDVVSVEFEKDR